MWRLLAKALGEKAGKTNKESDIIALIRLCIIGLNAITCLFIIANAIHHW